MRDKGPDEEYENQTDILSELSGLSYSYFAKAIDFGGANSYGNRFVYKTPLISADIPAIVASDHRPHTTEIIL